MNVPRLCVLSPFLLGLCLTDDWIQCATPGDCAPAVNTSVGRWPHLSYCCLYCLSCLSGMFVWRLTSGDGRLRGWKLIRAWLMDHVFHGMSRLGGLFR